MEELLNKLTGRLIGIARATEGNEHMVTASTADMVVEGLAATFSDSNRTGDALLALYNRADDEKRKLVPDCYNCMASCGRNNDYDMNRLENASEEVRNLKNLILVNLRTMAVCARHAAVLGRRDEEVHNFLYKGLFSIGMDDWDVEDLLPVVMEAAEANVRCVRLIDDSAVEAPSFVVINGSDSQNPELCHKTNIYTLRELLEKYPHLKTCFETF